MVTILSIFVLDQNPRYTMMMNTESRVWYVITDRCVIRNNDKNLFKVKVKEFEWYFYKLEWHDRQMFDRWLTVTIWILIFFFTNSKTKPFITLYIKGSEFIQCFHCTYFYFLIKNSTKKNALFNILLQNWQQYNAKVIYFDSQKYLLYVCTTGR